MNEIIASIHGNLCGDGSLYVFEELRDRRDIIERNRKNNYRLRYGITYTNNQKELLNKFRKNMKKLFPKMKFSFSRTNEVKLRNKEIVLFFKKYGEYGSRVWRIHNKIKRGNKEVKGAWIKSFCDDEATIAGNRIIVRSVNKSGLEDVLEMLNSLKIKAILRQYEQIFSLTIYDLVRFKELIDFDHSSKRQKLAEKLSTG